MVSVISITGNFCCLFPLIKNKQMKKTRRLAVLPITTLITLAAQAQQAPSPSDQAAAARANANKVIAEVGGRIRVAARPTQYERIEECERWGGHMAPADSASQRRCRARTAMRIAIILFRFLSFPRPNPDSASNWKAAKALRFEGSIAGTAPHRPTFARRHRLGSLSG